MYGHTRKRCRQKQNCRKCSGKDQLADHYTNELRNPNCGNGHMAGSSDCEAEKKREVNQRNAEIKHRTMIDSERVTSHA